MGFHTDLKHKKVQSWRYTRPLLCSYLFDTFNYLRMSQDEAEKYKVWFSGRFYGKYAYQY